MRAVLRRRTVRANSDNFNDTSVVTVTDTDFGRGAGEPEPGQQRECLGLAHLAENLGGEALGQRVDHAASERQHP